MVILIGAVVFSLLWLLYRFPTPWPAAERIAEMLFEGVHWYHKARHEGTKYFYTTFISEEESYRWQMRFMNKNGGILPGLIIKYVAKGKWQQYRLQNKTTFLGKWQVGEKHTAQEVLPKAPKEKFDTSDLERTKRETMRRKKPTIRNSVDTTDNKGLPKSRTRRKIKPKSTRGNVADPFEELDSLIGLNGVKQQMKSVAALVEVMKAREAKGYKVGSDSYHLVFTGNPGTGKTTVARIVGQIYRDLGVIKKGHVVERKRQDMGGHWRGDGSKFMGEAIKDAMDGVLFLDEIYDLNHGERSGHEDSLGTEIVNTLLTGLEDNRDRLVVIGAGYKKETELFLKTNPGMSSRFKTFIHFPDYTPLELMQIFELQCKNNEYLLSESARSAAKQAIDIIYAQRDEHFGNGREMRNFFEDCRQRQAERLSRNMPDDAAILLLEACDIVDKFGGKDISKDAEVKFHENDEVKRLEKENEELEARLDDLDGKIKTQRSQLSKAEQKTDIRPK